MAAIPGQPAQQPPPASVGGAASVQYWNHYVNFLDPNNWPGLYPYPTPGLNTPLIQQGGTHRVNGPCPIEDLVRAGHPTERGLGIFVGFAMPLRPKDPNNLDGDPEHWLCVYAKILNPKRQKKHPHKKDTRNPASADRRKIQLRVKALRYNHEPPADNTWLYRDNRIIGHDSGLFIQNHAWNSTPANLRVNWIANDIANHVPALDLQNRAHMNNIRRHGPSPMPALP